MPAKRSVLCLFAAFFCILSVSAAVFSDSGDFLSLGADTLFLYDSLAGQDIEETIFARLRLTDDFSLRLPCTLVFGYGSAFLDTGLQIAYYPFHTGPFVSYSLLEFGFELETDYLYGKITALNEIEIGWTQNLFERMFVEAALVIRDPSGTFEPDYAAIRGIFPGYSTFRLRLCAGWNAIRRPSDGIQH